MGRHEVAAPREAPRHLALRRDTADLRTSLTTVVLALSCFRLCFAPNSPAGSSLLSVSLVLIYDPGGCPSAPDATAITMIIEVNVAGAISFSLALKSSLRGQEEATVEKVRREKKKLRKEVEELPGDNGAKKRQR